MVLGNLLNEIIQKILVAIGVKDQNEGFEDKKESKVGKFFLALLVFVITLLITLFLSRLLWNKFLVPTIAFVNPIKSYLQMFGVLMALQLLK